jgi:hypothetical protein
MVMEDRQPQRAQEFRERAAGLRKIAAISSEARIQEHFLGLADQYEELARLLSGAYESR